MDFFISVITSVSISWLLMMFLLGVLLGLIFVPQHNFIKGWVGECRVRFYLFAGLERGVYKSIHNVTFPTSTGTTQIDHILISRYGIFVVEIKNFSGLIFGAEDDSRWTQKFSKRGRSYQFQSPLKQNNKHISALKDVINVADEAIFSLVVFAGKSIFKKTMPANVGDPLSALNYIKSKRNAHLSEDDVEQVVTAIEQARLPGGFLTRIIHSAHIKQLRKRRSSRPQKPQVQAKDDAPQCPRCKNVNLVQRKAKRGKHAGSMFWGCPNYPSCRAQQPL